MLTEDLIDAYGPEKIVYVSDSRTGMRGVLVIDNTARGVGKGGTRMAPSVSVTEIARLARTMTWKWSAVDLPYGGAKAGIIADPTNPDKESIVRAFARKLSNEVPSEYVFGLDMGMTEHDAAIIIDELGDSTASVGLPAELGGFPYDELGVTGYGVAESTRAALDHRDKPLSQARISIQGFGAVGSACGSRLADLGATVIAVSTSEGVVAEPDGLDLARLLQLRTEYGDKCVHAFGSPVFEQGYELTLDADVLVPAAREDVIDDALAREIRAPLVVEGANMPTNSAAQRTMTERGIDIVPDFIANAGGIIAAAYSMDARHTSFPPDPGTVLGTVGTIIRENTTTVLEDTARSTNTSHEVALHIAQQRVLAAMQLRGQHPGPLRGE